ncbi:MAG: hypothetical protein WC554_15805 [Clostridia bacterium]|jgi:hypothetical protein
MWISEKKYNEIYRRIDLLGEKVNALEKENLMETKVEYCTTWIPNGFGYIYGRSLKNVIQMILDKLNLEFGKTNIIGAGLVNKKKEK